MLDVRIALENPYTLDTIAVLRRKQVFNATGEAKTEVCKIQPMDAVVFPEGAEDLNRRAETQFTSKTLTVLTRFALRSEAETVDGVQYQPDIVLWNKDAFLVVRIEDWSQYGPGYTKATTESMDLNDVPPETE